MKTIKRAKKLKIISFVLLAILVVLPALSLGASAKDGRTVVRVGWYECPFNQTDEFDRRTGYAYEYQQKIAAYTGWTYEYVYGSWSELLQMLVEGKIDLLSDVSFTEERSEHMLFSSLPMGEEEY
ncbi:MAG: transporter substrate-binding domain-containing protein, partial [Clostridia bacterium]|nr:transporter substrate-binding domain-containing protein [Clostridia bacterium]